MESYDAGRTDIAILEEPTSSFVTDYGDACAQADLPT